MLAYDWASDRVVSLRVGPLRALSIQISEERLENYPEKTRAEDGSFDRHSTPAMMCSMNVPVSPF